VEIQRSFVVLNELGLHARAATRLVQTANRFTSKVEVEKGGQMVNGKSIMGVLMLVAAKSSTITIRVDGEDALEAMEALGNLIRAKFDED